MKKRTTTANPQGHPQKNPFRGEKKGSLNGQGVLARGN